MSSYSAIARTIIKGLFAAFISLMLVSCAGSNRTVKSGYQSTGKGIEIEKVYSMAGQHIVTALSKRDTDAFNRMINKKGMLDRTFNNVPFNKHVMMARTQLDSILDQAGIIMTDNFDTTTRLTFIRTRIVMHEHRALMRINMGNRGLSYIDFILEKTHDGLVKIVDWHDYAQGQLYSSSLRLALVFMFPRDNSLFATILGDSWMDSKSVEQFYELAHLAVSKKYKEWLTKYPALPQRLKYSRTVLVNRVLIASASGDKSEYKTALKDLCTHIGDDPSLSLMLVEHYLNEKNYTAAHAALNTLNNFTGGDAAIHLLKASVYMTEKNYPESIAYAQHAIMEDYALEEAYWTLLAVSIQADQYDIAIDTLRRLERQFGHSFDPDQIAQIKGYKKFASSSIFSDWKYGMIP